jgi:hypothetical protein
MNTEYEYGVARGNDLQDVSGPMTFEQADELMRRYEIYGFKTDTYVMVKRPKVEWELC